MRLLSAMTVGSLRMIPCRARRRACSPCRGRSRGREAGRWPLLGRPAPARRRSRARARAGRARTRRCCAPSSRPAVAQQHDRDADGAARATANKQERHVASPRPLRSGGWLDRPDRMLVRRAQSEPPDQCSCFQIGTVSFSVSMQNAAASNAASRCGDETDDQRPTPPRAASSPTRCSSATRSRSGQRRRASATISPIARVAPAPRTPRRSSRAHRRGPRRDRARRRRSVTTAPAAGVVAHASAASTGSGSSVERDPVARVGSGAASTATVYGTRPGRRPAGPSADRGRGRERDRVVTLARDGARRRRRRAPDDGPTTATSDPATTSEADDDRRPRRASRPARPALDPPDASWRRSRPPPAPRPRRSAVGRAARRRRAPARSLTRRRARRRRRVRPARRNAARAQRRRRARSAERRGRRGSPRSSHRVGASVHASATTNGHAARLRRVRARTAARSSRATALVGDATDRRGRPRPTATAHTARVVGRDDVDRPRAARRAERPTCRAAAARRARRRTPGDSGVGRRRRPRPATTSPWMSSGIVVVDRRARRRRARADDERAARDRRARHRRRRRAARSSTGRARSPASCSAPTVTPRRRTRCRSTRAVAIADELRDARLAPRTARSAFDGIDTPAGPDGHRRWPPDGAGGTRRACASATCVESIDGRAVDSTSTT